MDGVNKNIEEQLKILRKILRKNKKLMFILKKLDEYSKINPEFKNYYVGAGSINQTVFNYLSGFEINNGIKDFDIVYYNDKDISYEAEDIIIKDLEKILGNNDISYDIKNEARVHLWYEGKFEVKRDPYTSCEDAIASWGATITCIGARLENKKLIVYCPYGLNDLFTMTVRPLKGNFKREYYEERAAKWKSIWNNIEIVPWD